MLYSQALKLDNYLILRDNYSNSRRIMEKLMNDNLTYFQFESINEIISDLYNPDVPLHNRVIAFLRKVMEIVYFDYCTIIFFYKREDGIYEKHSSISINWDRKPGVVESYNEHYCHFDDTLPVMDNPNPVIFRASTFFDPDERSNNIYWTEYLLPNNCVHSIEGNIRLSSSNTLLGGFSFYRGAEKSDFSTDEVSIVKLLQPHLSNIFRHYGEAPNPTETFFLADGCNRLGVCIIDDNFQIIQQNQSFRAFSSGGTNEVSQKAVQLAMDLNKHSKDSTNSTIEYKFDEHPLFMEISITKSYQEPKKNQYICLVYDLSYYFAQSLKKAKDKYELTPREFDVLNLVLLGKRNDEIAAELFLSIPTVKKYLASLYCKMEIESQKQILDKLRVL